MKILAVLLLCLGLLGCGEGEVRVKKYLIEDTDYKEPFAVIDLVDKEDNERVGFRVTEPGDRPPYTYELKVSELRWLMWSERKGKLQKMFEDFESCNDCGWWHHKCEYPIKASVVTYRVCPKKARE